MSWQVKIIVSKVKDYFSGYVTSSALIYFSGPVLIDKITPIICSLDNAANRNCIDVLAYDIPISRPN